MKKATHRRIGYGIALIIFALVLNFGNPLNRCPVKVGDEVFHPIHGEGTVLAIVRAGDLGAQWTANCKVGARFTNKKTLLMTTLEIEAWKLYNREEFEAQAEELNKLAKKKRAKQLESRKQGLFL